MAGILSLGLVATSMPSNAATKKTTKKTTAKKPAPTTKAKAGGTTTTAAAAPSAAKSKNLNIALSPDLPSLEPNKQTNIWIRTLHMGNVTEPLVRLGADGSLQPRLATSWKFTTPTNLRFDLVRGVKFSNGEPFNAASVKFSIDQVLDLKYGSSNRGLIIDIDTVNIVDDYTVDFKLKQPSPDMLRFLVFVNMVEPKAAANQDIISKTPPGTGPYMIASKTTDTVVIKKNPNFRDPNVGGADQITFFARPDLASRVAGLKAGEYDAIDNVPTDVRNQLPAYVVFGAGATLTIQLNGQAPLMNFRLREAIIEAIDSETIRKALFGDEFSEPARCQYAVPGIAGYNPKIPNQRYNPTHARQLLQEIGMIGKTIRFATAPTTATSDQVTPLIVESLKAVGLNVDVSNTDFNTWFALVSRVEPAKRVEAFLITSTFDSGTVTRPWGTYVVRGSLFNQFPFDEDPGLEAVLKTAQTTPEGPARDIALGEASRRICNSNAAAFLYAVKPIWGIQKGLTFPVRTNSMLELTDLFKK